MTNNKIDDTVRSVLGAPPPEYIADVMAEGLARTQALAENLWYEANLALEESRLARESILNTEHPSADRALQAVLDYTGERYALGLPVEDLVLALAVGADRAVIDGVSPPSGTWEDWVDSYGRSCAPGVKQLVVVAPEDRGLVVVHERGPDDVVRYTATRTPEGVKWTEEQADTMAACPTLTW